MQRKTLHFLLLFLVVGATCPAQDSIPPEIRVDEMSDTLHFSAKLRPLRQIAGAPNAFYTWFWELGDGRFSFDKEPNYVYRDTGLYQVRLYATNNYDDGKVPPTRPRPVRVKKRAAGANTWAAQFFHGNGNIEIKINRNPRPGEDFVALVGYRNQSGQPADNTGGSIALFYNERQFGQNSFSLEDKRFYNREDSSNLNNLMAVLTPDNHHGSMPWQAQASGSAKDDQPALYNDLTAPYAAETRSMLQNLQMTYAANTVLHYPAVRAGEEKFVFMDINTLPSMIRDTNTTVVITAMLIPDNPAFPPETYRLEMPVVASHDPNHIDIRPRRINYRFMGKKKELTYKIQFQNTGKGPAKKIAIGIAIPRQLNLGSVQLKSLSPNCRWCDSAYNRQSCVDTVRSADSLYFIFNNIYLPGLQQDGVTDKDSTKGFVEYSIKFLKRPKKIPFNTRAAIIFDRNEAVYTNKATAKFIKGISPGIMGGYVYSPSNGNRNYSTKGSLQIGYVLAPYAPSRPYFQIEFFAGLLQKDETLAPKVTDQKDTAIGVSKYLITGRDSKTTVKRNSFEVTPLHYRYNICNWVGVGLGAQVLVNISEQTTVEKRVYLTSQVLPGVVTVASSSTKLTSKWLNTWNAAPFADLQLGRVRTGPTVGLRYLRLLKGDVSNRFFLYAGFKL